MKKTKNKKKNLVKTEKKTNKKKYVSAEIKRGTIQGTGRGYAFCALENGPDLFISESDLNGAIHGDIVAVKKIGNNKGGGEGRVVEIIERKFDKIVGVFRGREVVCSDRGIGAVEVDFFHPGISAQIGDKVVAQVNSGRILTCSVVEILGKEGDLTADIMGVIRSYKLAEKFHKSVLTEAKSLPDEVSEKECENRRDFRKDLTVTIDGDDSKDFDDAICVKKTDFGYRLYVHIADVTHYVKDGSKIDKEAFKRGTSVYFADRVLPMLPEKLSNGICSLNEGVDRLTLSVIMDYDEDCNLLNREIVNGVIRSKARLTYNIVEKMTNGDEELRAKYGDITAMLDTAVVLAKKLEKMRSERGAVEFDISESQITVENNKVVAVEKKGRLFSYKLIEEFMLSANETVAEFFEKRGVPFVYRAHENPPAEKIETLLGFLAGLGIDFTENPTPKDYAELVKSVDERYKAVVNRMALRSMSKAEYTTRNIGHFGLAAEYYCHFTSPIRRYPDLAIHRIIKYFLAGGEDIKRKFADFVRNSAKVGSERERIAEEAERKVDNLLMAKFMEDKIGNRYTSVVSGVTERGIYCELDNGIEGMVKVESMRGFGYHFDEKRMLISNHSYTYRIGDEVKIIVSAVNFDKVAFEIDYE
ncbi:MAG: ribonuclease R [Clostridia bacterium]|nr:ribonuclease R [Clostridia bacterium]